MHGQIAAITKDNRIRILAVSIVADGALAVQLLTSLRLSIYRSS
jgi:hypothetical protein